MYAPFLLLSDRKMYFFLLLRKTLLIFAPHFAKILLTN